MKVYAPKVSVRLVKSIRRDSDGLIPGMPVAARYGDLIALELTDYLGEGGVVTTSKSVREPAGGFTITLADRRHEKLLDSIYALVEPMDLIEIRFTNDPSTLGAGKSPPVVMRGLVTTVTRNESMQGGRPARAVTIMGQDFGKLLQIMQVYYLYDNGVMTSGGSNVLSEYAYFYQYAGEGDAKIKSAKDFVAWFIANVVNPQLKKLTAFADGRSVGAKVINEWSSSVTIEGAVSPYAVTSLNNVSLHTFLSSLLDVGPFNELFVEDTADGVRLVVRPAPFIGADGKLLQGVMPDVISIKEDDVVAQSVSRTDQGVANYFWVANSRFSLFSNEGQKMVAASGDPNTFIKFDYLNSKASIYGPRKMEVESVLVDPSFINSEGPKSKTVESQTGVFVDWLSNRRKLLADINKDNVIFESGTIQLRGNANIKAGTYLEIRRANANPYRAYVVKVDHSFVPLQGYTTSVTVERGTSFIERAKAKDAQYLVEMNAKGVA